MSTPPTEWDPLLPPAYSQVYPHSHHSRTNHFYKEKTLRRIGFLHIVVGVLCFVLGVCFAIVLPPFFQTNHHSSPWPFDPYITYNASYWMGVIAGSLFIITGIFGVLARRRNTCLIGFYMAASVVAALVAFGPLLVFSLYDLRNVGFAFKDDAEYTQSWTVLICMCGIMASLAVLEGMLSLTSLILCALKVCRCCEKRQMAVEMPDYAAPMRPETRGPCAPPPEI